MGWADAHIAKLKAGETVQFRPHGHSMKGRIASGQLCTVAPVLDLRELCPGNIVLCKVNGKQYVHLIKAVRHQTFLIGNNQGHTNGWCGPNAIYGKLIKVED